MRNNHRRPPMTLYAIRWMLPELLQSYKCRLMVSCSIAYVVVAAAPDKPTNRNNRITKLANSLIFMQIVTGIEVNSEAYFPRFPKCRRNAGNIPATEGNKTHYWPMMTVTICFVIPVIEMGSELISIRGITNWYHRQLADRYYVAYCFEQPCHQVTVSEMEVLEQDY